MGMTDCLFISRYSHFIPVDDKFVLINSLFLKPVVVTSDTYDSINKRCCGNIFYLTDISDDLYKLIDELKNNKILLENSDDDNRIVERIRNLTSSRIPLVVYFVVSEQCNFNCKYCFINDSLNSNNTKKEIMSKIVARDGWELFKHLTTSGDVSDDVERYVIIYGGEPLTNFDVVSYLINLINDDIKTGNIKFKTHIAMNTNGSLLNHEILNCLIKNNVGIAVSVDGNKNCNSDRVFISGDETFDVVNDKIELSLKSNADISLSVTLTDKTVNNFQDTIEYLISSGVKNVGFNLMMPNKNTDINDSYGKKSSEFLLNAYPILADHGIYEDRMMRKINAFCKQEIYAHDCAATAGAQFVIAPNGDIGICQGLLGESNFKISNVCDDNSNLFENPIFETWSRRSPIFLQSCQKCRALGICGGGCPKNSLRSKGSISFLDENFCTHTKTSFDWILNKIVKSLSFNNLDVTYESPPTSEKYP